MVEINTIHALRETVQKLGDAELKSEILGKLTEVLNALVAKQGEIEAMRAQLAAANAQAGQFPELVYDPPV